MQTSHSYSPAAGSPDNQPPVLEDYNLFGVNCRLQETLAREGAQWAHEELLALGAQLGSSEWIKRGDDANRHPPLFKPFDRQGRRRDEFEFHPAWHDCMRWLKRQGVDTGAWADPRPGAHVRRAALFQLFAEIECGSLCPTTMTYGAVPPVSRVPDLSREWLPLLLSRDYDPRTLPAAQKSGVTMGMGMTEKQGGSDVRANTTRADPAGNGWYALTGHKWFFSASMSDAFLVTAQTAAGLSCFFLPRILGDGTRNAIHLLRAKDKLGDRSNAGAEVEFHGALARLLGEEGRGVPTVIEMATYTRLDCANGSAGIMRQALSQALHHATHRRAFGARLIDQPLMRNVLADMALEVEGHVALAMRVAGAFDRQQDEAESELRRLITPVAKYWVCRRCPALTAEAMEVIGGNGYVEEGPMPRLYRQAPLNSIWEGSGNVMCLDVLRAMRRHPRSVEALHAELEPVSARDPLIARHVARLMDDLRKPEEVEACARRLVERIALGLEAALLVGQGPQELAEAFSASRLGGDWDRSFGTLSPATHFEAILGRAWPA
jgi:putative acyl-CoA dehydrogenase